MSDQVDIHAIRRKAFDEAADALLLVAQGHMNQAKQIRENLPPHGVLGRTQKIIGAHEEEAQGRLITTLSKMIRGMK